MADIGLFWDDLNQRGDIAIANGDIVMDETLGTSVLLSLACDRVANADDDLPAGADPRGWWGDSSPDGVTTPPPMGARFWLLRRQSLTTQTRRQAEVMARQALQWLIDNGIATDIAVTSALVGQNLGLGVQISRNGPNGRGSSIYAAKWSATLAS
ncbi:MAG: phage GP46 family protein [Xanthomonadaceae bacterium]|nr:phage GP46 family protein [Xanthomonadaceae bacterium]